MRNNTVRTTEITPVESEVTKTKKQESRDIGHGKFNCCGFRTAGSNNFALAKGFDKG